MCRRIKIDPSLSPCTKLKFKWIKDLNIMLTTLNLIEEKVGSIVEHIGTGDHFLNITPVAQILRETINKWGLLKLRSFCKAKDVVNKTKPQPTKWERSLLTTHNKGQGANLQNIQRNQKKMLIKRTNNPI